MANDLLRGYLQLASGIGELTRARTLALINGVLDLDAVKYLFRQEVEAAAGRLGLVSAEELEQARDQVRRLQAQIAQLRPPSAAVPDVADVADARAGHGPHADAYARQGAVSGPSGNTGVRRRAPRSATKRANPTTVSAAASDIPTDAGAKDRGAKKSAAKKALRSSTGKRAMTKRATAEQPAQQSLSEPDVVSAGSAKASADVFADAAAAKRSEASTRAGTAKRTMANPTRATRTTTKRTTAKRPSKKAVGQTSSKPDREPEPEADSRQRISSPVDSSQDISSDSTDTPMDQDRVSGSGLHVDAAPDGTDDVRLTEDGAS